MSPSSTLSSGLEVHKESIAVASVAQEHGAEVTALRPHRDPTSATAINSYEHAIEGQALVFISEAGPCGDWLYRDLTQNGL